jgi:putative ABC transport system permease protein
MSLLQDLRFGLRLAWRQPALTAIAVLALTLGIGLTTMMFSMIQGSLLRGLPFDEADRILVVSSTDMTRPDNERLPVLQHDFAEWREAQRSFEVFAAFYGGTVNVSGNEGRPERYEGAFMTARGFDVTRVRPLLGRTFIAADERPGAPKVVVLGYPIWRDRFERDSAVVGRPIRINGQPATVVGVMPEGFMFPMRQQIWVPLALDVARTARGDGMSLIVFGRLAAGVSSEQAQAEMATLARRQATEHPATNEHRGVVVLPYIQAFFGSQLVNMLYTMLAAVLGVLLIACANVTNLLLARASTRSKEIAIRTALGAGRRRVMGQLLGEALVLAAIGTLLGLVVAHVGLTVFTGWVAMSQPPFWIDFRLDGTVLLFTAAITFVAAMASGILPALQASRCDVNDVLKDESRGTSGFRLGRFSKALVVAEIAVSCGLLVAAGLAIRSVVNLSRTDFAFDTTSVFTARLGLFEANYPDEASRVRFYDELLRRLEALPGARSAAIAQGLPTMGGERPVFAVEGRAYPTDLDYPMAMSVAASPGYFETLGKRVLRGRDFSSADVAGAPPVAIVNQSFAAKLFAGEDPIGRRIRVGRGDSREPWITIVGVAPDLYMSGIENLVPEGFYVPLAQRPPSFASLAVLAKGEPAAMTSSVRAAVSALDPDLPLYWVRTMAESIAENSWYYRVFGSLFMMFGIAALFLATVGLYGVTSFSVSRRTHEIGVRMAIGADRRRVLGHILRQGAVQLALGLAAGLVIAAGLSQLLTFLLFGVEPWDPATFISVILTLAAAALAAMLVPARRAMRIDPVIALRYE